MRAPTNVDSRAFATPGSVSTRVDSRRGPHVLASGLRPLKARLDVSTGTSKTETLTLQFDNTLIPVDEWSPLAAMGQTLHVFVDVDLSDGTRFTVDRGWFLIQEVSPTREGGVNVTCKGLMQRLADDPFPFPSSPPAGSTLRTELERLCYPYLSVVLDGVSDRGLPGGLAWGRSRTDAVESLLSSYGLVGRVMEDGALHVVRPDSSRVDARYSDGTLVLEANAKWTHTHPNHWLAVGSKTESVKTDAKHSHSVKHDWWSEAWADGAFDKSLYGVVTEVVEAKAAEGQYDVDRAAGLAVRRFSPSGVKSFTMVPDYRIDIGDVVSVDSDLGNVIGSVSGYSMPLDDSVETMRIDIEGVI